MTNVGAALAGFLLTSFATEASADAWAAFETRCLIPMENIAGPDFADLAPVGVDVPFDAYALDPQTTFFVDVDRCGISPVGPKTEARFAQWVSDARSSDRYVLVEDEIPDVVLHLRSTLWREPVQDVILEDSPTYGLTLWSVETHLES